MDCNRGTGTYTVDGPRLTIEPGATTLIACGPGSQDRVFLQDLRNVATYVMDGPNLILNLKVDGGNMIFNPQPPTSLTGGPWRVQSYNNGRGGVVSVLPDVQLTATFDPMGNVSGNAGCNSYRGPYEIAGNRLTFGPIVSTKRACLSDALTQQETAFLAALDASTTLRPRGRPPDPPQRCRRDPDAAGPAERPACPGRLPGRAISRSMV